MPGGEWTIPTAELHQAGLRIEVSPRVKIFFATHDVQLEFENMAHLQQQ